MIRSAMRTMLRSTITALLLAVAASAQAQAQARLQETPYFSDSVAMGKLPPLFQRLPENPSTVPMNWAWQTPGRPGGDVTMLMSSAKDVRLMVVYGFARLASYTPDYTLQPDLAERIDVQDGRIFTFYLRKGHRWSDGTPFTAEDFRYWWEDVANNDALSPVGPPEVMRVDGELPKFDIIDETTIRYSWSKPNPSFLPQIAAPSPLYIYRPSAYLKRYHEKYADPETLKAEIKKAKQRDWAVLHNRKDNMYRNDNPELPSLDPWVLKTMPPSERFVFERNPYYHRVDPNGWQLPYIDRMVMQIADGKIIPAKVGAGEADLQARYLRFDNYTFLKDGEKRTGKYKVYLWQGASGAKIALYPNLNARDPVWRQLLRDVRFRRALSLAIDRVDINETLYFGLGVPGNNTVLEGSALFKPEYRDAWAQYDPELANKLLDEIGLTQRNDDGIRLLPNGEPLQIVVETAGESTEETDLLELIGEHWRQVGVKLFSRPSERETFRNRIFAGQTIMSVWAGLENGRPTADLSPWEIAPTSQQTLNWPAWGQFLETGEESGEPVDLPEAQKLLELYEAWNTAASTEDRTRIWHEMLSIYTDQVFTIGTVSGVPQPVVGSARLRNIPADGIFSWEPGGHIGVYRPDTFWLDNSIAAN